LDPQSAFEGRYEGGTRAVQNQHIDSFQPLFRIASDCGDAPVPLVPSNFSKKICGDGRAVT
jgi:hypothetical protein